MHPGCEHQAARRTPGTGCAAEDQVARLDEWPAGIVQIGRPERRQRLPRERRRVDLEGSIEQTDVRRDPVTFLDHEHVAGNEVRRGHDLVLSLAEHLRLRRQVALERFDRSAGLLLLHEGESRVQHDYGDDRDCQHRCARRSRQSSRQPQQQCQRVRELPGQVTGPGRRAPLAQLI